jgi:hypothetical protein
MRRAHRRILGSEETVAPTSGRLSAAAIVCIALARSSTRADGHEVPGVYRVQAFRYALQQAERAAGVPHRELRAAHGSRRMVAGEVLAQTGDPKLAMDFIGDTDLRVMQRYLKRRDDRLVALAAQLDTPKGATEVPREPALGKVARESEPRRGKERATGRI